MPDGLDDYLDPLPRTPRRRYDEDTALNLIAQHESGGRNIKQQVVPSKGGFNPSVGRVTGPSTAQGPWQITNTTWRKRGPREIVQRYPTAMSAPVEVQREVARKIYRETGFSDWAPYNASLRRAINRGEQPQQQRGELDNYLDPLPQPTRIAQPNPKPRRVRQQPTPQVDAAELARQVGGAVTGAYKPPLLNQAQTANAIRQGVRATRGVNTAGDIVSAVTDILPDAAVNWLGGAAAKGVVSPVQMAAGALGPSAPASVKQPIQRFAREAGEVGQYLDQNANRWAVSQETQNLVAGGIGSSPAMILTALGVPAPVAFGAQSYLESTGQDKAFNEVVKDTAKGATIGALFEIPLPAKQGIINAIGTRLTRMGIVGGGTELINQATGASDPKSALVNALFAGAGGAKRETSAEIPEKLGTIPRRGRSGGVPEPAIPVGARPSELEPYLNPVKSTRELPPEATEGIKQARELMRNDIGQFRRKTSDEKVKEAVSTQTLPAELITPLPSTAPPTESAIPPAGNLPEAATTPLRATTAPTPAGRSLMESAYPESRGPIKDFKGRPISERGDAGERGAALLPSREQLTELGRAAINVPSRISYQRIAGPIERMVEQHRAVRGVEFEAERLKRETARQLVGLSRDEQIAIIDAAEHDYKGPFWDALSPRQQAIANQLKPVHDMMAEYNRKFDVFPEREMPEGVRHLFHWWNNPETGRPYDTQWGEFSKTGPSGRQRTIETYAEGRTGGMTQASTNLGEILGKSFEQSVRVKEARDLIDNLKIWKMGDLKGLVGEIPKGLEDRYEQVNIPALKPTVYVPQGEGVGLLVKQPVYALKELAPKLRAYFEKPEWTKLDEVMSAAKSLKLSLSFFHGLGLTFKNMTMFRFRTVHDVRNGLRFMEGMDDTMKRLYSNGLETALSKDYADLTDATGHFNRRTLIGKVSDITHKNPMSRLIFSYVRVGLKNAYAHDTYGKMEPLYVRRMEKSLGRPLTDAETVKAQNQAARAVVERASNLFSGEDKRLGALEASDLVTRLYFNPKAQRIWQKALISPTWQREHLIEAKNLGKSIVAPGMMGPIAREHIKQAFGAATLMAVADLTNYFMTKWNDEDKQGKHLWQNPAGSRFSVRLPWNEPEYSVTDKNGKSRKIPGGPAFVRPFKAITEVPEVVAALFAKEGERDIVDKLSAKVHPWVQAAAEQMQFSGEKRKQGTGARVKALVSSVAPIAADQPVRVIKKERTPLDLIPWLIGAPTQKPMQVRRKRP